MNKQQTKIDSKPIKITSNKLAERLEEERETIKLAEKQKRTVYEAICTLSEPVSEQEMLNHLKVLDLHSWAEVIEERFLGKICGYPICVNKISIDFRRKFVWIGREGRREFIPTEAEPNKFCSDRCMCLARAIAIQLDTEEQQINSLRSISTKSKEFKLPNGDEWKNFLTIGSNKCSDKEEVNKIKIYAEAQLVKGINDLKIADNVEESDDDEDEEKDEDSEKEEERFLEKIKTLSINTKIPKNTSRCIVEDKETKENDENKESKTC